MCVALLMFWEEQARTAGLSLQVLCGSGQSGQPASDWVALGLIQTILSIVPRNDLWDSCPLNH